MRAAYIQNGAVHTGTMPDPVPGKGQALVRTHSCGMCASEQHFLHAGAAGEIGMPDSCRMASAAPASSLRKPRTWAPRSSAPTSVAA